MMAELDCTICLEKYADRNPRMLDCHHTFCQSCVQDLIDKTCSRIQCPTCRKYTQVPEGDASKLSKNFYVQPKDPQENLKEDDLSPSNVNANSTGRNGYIESVIIKEENRSAGAPVQRSVVQVQHGDSRPLPIPKGGLQSNGVQSLSQLQGGTKQTFAAATTNDQNKTKHYKGPFEPPPAPNRGTKPDLAQQKPKEILSAAATSSSSNNYQATAVIPRPKIPSKWQWESNEGTWEFFEGQVAEYISESKAKGILKLDLEKNYKRPYIIDLKENTQENKYTGTKRNIRRTPTSKSGSSSKVSPTWQWWNEGDYWCDYEEHINRYLNEAKEGGTLVVNLELKFQMPYTIDLEHLTQTRNESKVSRPIRLKAKEGLQQFQHHHNGVDNTKPSLKAGYGKGRWQWLNEYSEWVDYDPQISKYLDKKKDEGILKVNLETLYKFPYTVDFDEQKQIRNGTGKRRSIRRTNSGTVIGAGAAKGTYEEHYNQWSKPGFSDPSTPGRRSAAVDRTNKPTPPSAFYRRKGYTWQWNDIYDWIEYDPEVCEVLESSLEKEIYKIDLANTMAKLPYIVNLKKLEQERPETGMKRKIRRIPPIPDSGLLDKIRSGIGSSSRGSVSKGVTWLYQDHFQEWKEHPLQLELEYYYQMNAKDVDLETSDLQKWVVDFNNMIQINRVKHSVYQLKRKDRK